MPNPFLWRFLLLIIMIASRTQLLANTSPLLFIYEVKVHVSGLYFPKHNETKI